MNSTSHRSAAGGRLAGLMLLLALTAAAEESPSASELRCEWKLEGSDLAMWDVTALPANLGDAETVLDRSLSLALYGYQIDRRGQAHFPTHVFEDIAFDLALQAPIGKAVREGVPIKIDTLYDHLRDHMPLEVSLTGTVVQFFGANLRFQGKATARPQPEFDLKAFPGGKHRFTYFAADVEIVFDTSQGMMTEATVRLEGTTNHRDVATGTKAPPPPTNSKAAYAFKLRRIRDYYPARLESAIGSAIDGGVGYLRSKLGADSTYGAYSDYVSGETCIVALTLLVCGADREDPFILSLMDQVRAFPAKTCYEVSIALMAMEAFYAPADEVSEVHAGRRPIPLRRQIAKADLDWMAAQVGWLLQLADRKPAGLAWGYHPATPRPDLSNTQYAALGLLSAWRCGLEIPEEVWVELGKGLFRNRLVGERAVLDLELITDKAGGTSSGRRVEARGFGYEPGATYACTSMTTAALSTLRIVRDVLKSMKSRHTNGRLGKEIEQALDGAWAWLGKNWIIQRHAPDRARDWSLYTLYGLERAAVLCGVRAVNGRDWYFEGAAWLVETQGADGHWTSGDAHLHQTCFALLFLKRGTIPVLTGE